MKRHTKIYMDFFGYDKSDFIPSELSGRKAVDINHIDARGIGGNPSGDKDVIENLMALTREEHEKFGDKKRFKQLLIQAHRQFMETKVPYFDNHVVIDYSTGARLG